MESAIALLFFVGAVASVVVVLYYMFKGAPNDSSVSQKSQTTERVDIARDIVFEKAIDELDEILFKYGERRSREELRQIAKDAAHEGTDEKIIDAVYRKIPNKTPTPDHFFEAYQANVDRIFTRVIRNDALRREFEKVKLRRKDITEKYVIAFMETQRKQVGEDLFLFRFNYEQFALTILLIFLEKNATPSLEQKAALKRLKEFSNDNGYFFFDLNTSQPSPSAPQASHADDPHNEPLSSMTFPTTSNAKRLLDLCEQFIDKYEVLASNTLVPTAKYDLMKKIKKQVEADKEIPTWKEGDVNYDKIANVLLANASFDLLASGVYHIHAGTLNPMNCSGKMMAVYNGAMKWSVENGYNDEKTRQEQYDYLLKCISEVG